MSSAYNTFSQGSTGYRDDEVVEADDVEPKHAGSTFCRTNKGVVLVIGLLATSVAFWGGGGRQRNGFTSGLAALDSRQEKKRPAKPQPNQTNH